MIWYLLTQMQFRGKKSGLGPQLVNVKKKREREREVMGVVTIAQNVCDVRREASQA